MKGPAGRTRAATAAMLARANRFVPGRRTLPATAPAVLTVAALSLLGAPLSSNAYETVTVNGNLWACQHSCVVTEIGGALWVRDSAGGWAARIALNGEAVQNDPL